MKKFIIKQELRIMEMADRAKRYGKDKASQAIMLLTNNQGDETSTSHMGWVILVVVIVLVAGAAMIGIFKDTVIPGVGAKLGDIFNLG